MFKFIIITLLMALLGACSSASKNADYVHIFNGKDLEGWKATFGDDSFSVKGGILKAHSTGKGPHLLFIGRNGQKKYKNFELVVVSKAEPNSNSGIYFHTDGTFRNEQGWLHYGYEVQLNCTAKEKRKTASLYGVEDLAVSPVNESEWFEIKIRVEDKRIQVWANGKQTVDYTEPERPQRAHNRAGRLLNPDGGFIALQAHDLKSIWYFKEIKIKEL
jgi:hypothetical protein